jgi:hypothetical protein
MIKFSQFALPETGFDISFEQLNTITTFQRLWSDMAYWMRNYIISTTFELPNIAVTEEQLNKSSADFYNAFSSYYGTEIAQELVNLLLNFIVSGKKLAQGIKSNDQEQINTSAAQWYQNADELSIFLARINVFWDNVIWINFLNQYIKASIDEMLAIAGANYEQEVAIHNRIQDLTLLMGRFMARGIIAAGSLNQTPSRTL